MDKEQYSELKRALEDMNCDHREKSLIEEFILVHGYVKAPKNELIPLSKSALIEFLDELYHDPEYLADELMKKFGSSGKRPLNEQELFKLICSWALISGVNDDYLGDLAYRICKEFSTAEVRISEERIKSALVKIAHEHKMQFDNKLETVAIFGELDKLAKAIKEELEKK